MRVVLCNCAPSEAEKLANTVVTEGLAACVNIIPGVLSVYKWQGEIHRDQECTLIIKVSGATVDALRRRLVELHSYDTVEFLSLPVRVDESDSDYVGWVRESSGEEGAGK